MKSYVSALLCCAFFVGCAPQKEIAPKALEPANMDLSVRPGDNFFRYANGHWLDSNPVPGDYSRWGTFEMLFEQNTRDLRRIFETAMQASSDEQNSKLRKIGDFYASGMDSLKIEEAGLEPIRDELERIAEIRTIEAVQKEIANLHSMEISTLFAFFSGQDPRNSEMMIPWLYQGGLGMPDRDYYLETSGRAPEIRQKYQEHLVNMFELMGDSPEEAAANAEIVMSIETRLAKASMTQLEQRNPIATTNKMTIADLEQRTPAFDWNNFFDAVGLDIKAELNVAQPAFFAEVGKMMESVSVADWKIYLRWHLIDDVAPYLSSEFVNESFAFNGRVLRGQMELRPRWKRSLVATSDNLGELVGQVYVEEFFPPEAKERMFDLVMNLKAAFRQRIQNVDWMTDETKQKALAKLEAFGVKVGYPDAWIDYSDLEINRDSYVGNILRAWQFDFERDVAKMFQPVDRKEWGMSPQTVNAYYNPAMNEIVFPAAILQPPFFNLYADDPVNYGAIGAVIGHEMTHGFDDQGRQYDINGNLNDWWTAADAEAFNKRTQVLVDQFDHFVVLDTNTVDGELTLGENIADLGGLSIAFDALQMAMQAEPAQTIDGLTPEQRFFLAWAQVWRSNIREENQLLRLKTDVHSPAIARVNGPFRNIDAFYTAFAVNEDNTLYLPETERAQVW